MTRHDAQAAVEAAWEAGIRYFDTASPPLAVFRALSVRDASLGEAAALPASLPLPARDLRGGLLQLPGRSHETPPT